MQDCNLAMMERKQIAFLPKMIDFKSQRNWQRDVESYLL